MIEKAQKHQPNTTPILFVNWTREDFTHSWDNKPTTIKSSEQLWLPLWLAEHFSKHLVDRELNRMNLPTNHPTRETLIAKCIGNKPETETINDDPLGLKVLNANMRKTEPETLIKRKGGRPRKIPATTDVPPISDEATFEGK